MKPSNKVFISSMFALGEAEAIFAKFTEDSFKIFEDHPSLTPSVVATRPNPITWTLRLKSVQLQPQIPPTVLTIARKQLLAGSWTQKRFRQMTPSQTRSYSKLLILVSASLKTV